MACYLLVLSRVCRVYELAPFRAASLLQKRRFWGSGNEEWVICCRDYITLRELSGSIPTFP